MEEAERLENRQEENKAKNKTLSKSDYERLIYFRQRKHILASFYQINKYQKQAKDLRAIIETEHEQLVNMEEKLRNTNAALRSTVQQTGRKPSMVNTSTSEDQLTREELLEALKTVIPKAHKQAQFQAKLPTVEIPEFAGTIQDYPEWWNTFYAQVDRHDYIPEDTKLQYLKSALTGEAKSLLWGIGMQHLSYKMALDKIKKAYARPDLIKDHFMYQLNTLKPTANTTKAYRDFHRSAETIIAVLAQYNIDISTYGAGVVSTFIRLFSTDMRQRLTNRANGTVCSKMDLRMFLDTLNEELESIEDASAVTGNNGFSITSMLTNTDKTKKKKWGSKKSNKQFTCYFCSATTHFSNNCNVVTDPATRFKNVTARQSCTNCLGSGHIFKDCRSYRRCYECKGKHHTSLHDYFKNPNTDKQTSHTAVTQSSSVTMYTAQEETDKVVLMGTAVAPISSTAQSKNGRTIQGNLLLDPCSEETFISRQAVNNLKLKTVGKKVIGIHSFEHSSKPREFEVVEVYLQTSSGPEVFRCLVADTIVQPIKTTDWALAQEHFPELELSHLNASEFAVTIMIGVKDLYKIRCPSIIKRGSLEARLTTVGWVVDGPLNVPGQTIHKKTMLTSCNNTATTPGIGGQ